MKSDPFNCCPGCVMLPGSDSIARLVNCGTSWRLVMYVLHV